MSWLTAQAKAFGKILAAIGRIAEYDAEAEREWRRLRGGSHMDNRYNAAERFIDERQREAMAVVARASLQREATQAARATWEGEERQGLFARLGDAVRRVVQREPARQVVATVQVRKS